LTFEWTETQTELTFRVGERSIFSVPFRCLALTAHFTQLGTDPMQPRPPFERFGSGVDVAMMRSHPIREPLPVLSRLPEAIRYVPAQYPRYYTDLQQPFDAYLKRFSAKSRSTLLRKVRKFATASGGAIEWREFRNADEMPEFYDQARRISKKTYQERLLDAGLPDDADFLRAACEAAAKGEARGYLLYLQGKPIAYIFCSVADGAVSYDYVGYDPEFHQLSPGTVLQHLVLETLMSQGGCKMFDFTEGASQHKEFFATHHVLCANIFYFRPTLRNRLLLSLHAFSDSLSTRAGALLDRMGLKARIKKLLRAAA
jgi:CelD/BcsL family acetyltransferase involved in cellulose biosynthesis